MSIADQDRLKVQAIQKFTSTASAVEDLSAVQDGRLTDTLSKFLVDAMGGSGEIDGEKNKKKKKLEEMLVVSEPKLGMAHLPLLSDFWFSRITAHEHSLYYQQNPFDPRRI